MLGGELKVDRLQRNQAPLTIHCLKNSEITGIQAEEVKFRDVVLQLRNDPSSPTLPDCLKKLGKEKQEKLCARLEEIANCLKDLEKALEKQLKEEKSDRVEVIEGSICSGALDGVRRACETAMREVLDFGVSDDRVRSDIVLRSGVIQAYNRSYYYRRKELEHASCTDEDRCYNDLKINAEKGKKLADS